MSDNKCVCEDTSLEKNVTCFNNECDNDWSVEMEYFERVSNCPLHHTEIAICGGFIPLLCVTCKSNGYSISSKFNENTGFFRKCTCDKK